MSVFYQTTLFIYGATFKLEYILHLFREFHNSNLAPHHYNM